MTEDEVNSQLYEILSATNSAKSDDKAMVLRFVEKLKLFIRTASIDEKIKALSKKAFSTDFHHPPDGQMGFTSYLHCTWRYDEDGALVVTAIRVT